MYAIVTNMPGYHPENEPTICTTLGEAVDSFISELETTAASECAPLPSLAMVERDAMNAVQRNGCYSMQVGSLAHTIEQVF